MTATIEALFQRSRILVSDLKNVCGITTNGTRTTDTLVWYARQIAFIDLPHLPTPTDEDIIREYGIEILPENPTKLQNANYTIDRRLALSIAVSAVKPKGADDAKNYENFVSITKKHLRSMWVPVIPQQQSIMISEQKQENPLISVPANQTTLNMGIPILRDVSSAETNLVQNDNNFDLFPVESKVKKSRKEVSDFILSHIKNNSSEFKHDEMVRINDLIESTGLTKSIADWNQNKGSENYILAVMQQTKKPREKVFVSIKGGRKMGTWANIYVAIEIARWIDPYFSVMVNDIFLRVMRGDISLAAQILDNGDAIHGTRTDISSTAPGNSNQIRQTTIMTTDLSTETPEQQRDQEQKNDQHAAFNHKLFRELDYSNPIPLNALYHIKDSKRKLNPGIVDRRNLECALVTLYPEMFPFDKNDKDNKPSVYDLMESMWYKLVAFENDPRIQAKEYNEAEEKKSEDQEALLQKYHASVEHMTQHIVQLKSVYRLKPLIDSLAHFKPSRLGSYQDDKSMDIGKIYELLIKVFSGDHIDPSTVNELNFHMNSKIGLVYKNVVDFRNLTAVVSDMVDIFRADLSAPDFNPVLPKDFGSIFAEQDEKDIGDESPAYYHALISELDSFAAPENNDDASSEYSDSASSFGSSASYNYAPSSAPSGPISDVHSQIDPTNAYSAVSMHLPKDKKKAAPSRSRVAKRAQSLNEDLRASLTRCLEDRINSVAPVVIKCRDEQTINLYLGQEGYAFRITPRIISSIPRIVLVLSHGEILEAPAYHLRPAGQITVTKDFTGAKPYASLVAAKIPGLSRAQDMYVITQNYNGQAQPPTHVIMLRAVIAAIGSKNITSVTYSKDLTGQSWSIVMPSEL